MGKISLSERNVIHQWIRKNYGKASSCENKKCLGISKNYDYALITGMEYERKRENYKTLCRSCHFKYDYAGGKFESQKKAFHKTLQKTSKINGRNNRMFSPEKTKEIREIYSKGKLSHRKLGEIYKCSYRTIGLITKGRTYAEIK